MKYSEFKEKVLSDNTLIETHNEINKCFKLLEQHDKYSPEELKQVS